MFGMGMNEVLIVLVIAVIVIGPKQLPQIARTMGKMMAQFKRATNDLRNTISDEVSEHVPMNEFNEIRDNLETGVRDLQDQSRSLVSDEFEDEHRIGQDIANDLQTAYTDMPSGELDYAPGNGGEPKKKPRKRASAKGVRKSSAAAASKAPAGKSASTKRVGKGNGAAKSAAARVLPAKSMAGKNPAVKTLPPKTTATKSAGKRTAKSRQSSRA